jgi:hypothetical protein
MEEWKLCLESDKCYYYISNVGRAKSITKVNKVEKILKERLNKNYSHINVSNKNYTVHTLVALHFIGPRPDGYEIDHKNRIRNDNRIENLRYCTKIENMRNVERFRTDILEQDSKERRKITDKEYKDRYYIKNKDEVSKKCKLYREKNKDKIAERRSIKYLCECGSKLNKDAKARHERSNKHQNYLKSL